MKIRMKRSALGADDQITVVEYTAGAEYDVGADLARCFISAGDAEYVETRPMAPDEASPVDATAPVVAPGAFAKFDDSIPGGSLPGKRKKGS